MDGGFGSVPGVSRLQVLLPDIRGGSWGPAVSQEGGCQLQEGLCLTGASVFSAGHVFQLPLPLRGVGLLPGSGAAAARGG